MEWPTSTSSKRAYLDIFIFIYRGERVFDLGVVSEGNGILPPRNSSNLRKIRKIKNSI